MTDWGVHLLDILQMAFDEAMPVSIAAQGGKFYVNDNLETPDTMLVTYRYPGFIGSYESRTANSFPMYDNGNGTSFHGDKATLMVNRSGYWMWRGNNSKPAVEEKRPEVAEMGVPHWQNWLECIRTRQKPVSDIETCVRSSVTCILANLAMRSGLTLDWDDKAFTVKQTEAKPLLKATYRAPWKLEV
jgi:predicted dehydrogenase